MRLFTKSAFKQALHCPASLYYYYDREHYANQMNEDDFLQALADGGNQVGDLAKVYYDVKAEADIQTLDYEKALEKTAELFKRDDVTIAEAAFRWEECFVRADIIKKKGKVIELIEVKAKSWDPHEDHFWGNGRNANSVRTDIREYVYDVAFQKYVIQNALGAEYTVKASLMMADKSVVSDAPDGVNQFFRIVKTDKGSDIIRESGANSLRNFTWVLKAFDEVDEVCDRIIAGATDEQLKWMGCLFTEFVKKMAHQYVKHEHLFSPLSDECFKCPFFSNEKTPNMLDGKKECWREIAGFDEDDFLRPSIEDLWCGFTGSRSLKKELVEKKKYFLSDVTEEDIQPQNLNGRARGLTNHERRLLQIGLATKNEEFLSRFKDNIHDDVYLDIPSLREEMKPSPNGEGGWRFPLHMIDFETSSVALPFYKGRRPYEQIAFQFSHHIIYEDGTIEHRGQYLNTKKHHFPNFEFVRELKTQLEGDNGTIFRYADHENTILRAIRRQLDCSQEEDRDELISFIDSITHYKVGKDVIAGPRDMVDLLEIVRRYYYHPDMKGSNSIKAVLPAILNSSKTLQEKYSKPIYGSLIHSENYTPEEAKAWISIDPDGKVGNPYKHLDTIASFLGVTTEELEQFDTAQQMDESIANGGAALAAYTKLQFSDSVLTDALAKALLRYCELDTMSMVFIWEYFNEMTS